MSEEPSPSPAPPVSEEPFPSPTPPVSEEPSPLPAPPVSEEPSPSPVPPVSEELVPDLDHTLPTPTEKFFLAPDAKSNGRGTENDPWSLSRLMDGERMIPPGSHLILLPSDKAYRFSGGGNNGIQSILWGTEELPIIVRPMSRAYIPQIDASDLRTGIRVKGAHTIFHRIGIGTKYTSSQRDSSQFGSNPTDILTTVGIRAEPGENVGNGDNCKVSCCELSSLYLGILCDGDVVNGWCNEGNIIYDIGWSAPDRPHGHAIYAQNILNHRPKYHINNIIRNIASHGLHCYSSGVGRVDNMFMLENFVSNCGERAALFSGGSIGSNLTVRRNWFESVVQLGSKAMKDSHVEDNRFFGRVQLGSRNYERMLVVNNYSTGFESDAVRSKFPDNFWNEIYKVNPVAHLRDIFDPHRHYFYSYGIEEHDTIWTGESGKYRCYRAERGLNHEVGARFYDLKKGHPVKFDFDVVLYPSYWNPSDVNVAAYIVEPVK